MQKFLSLAKVSEGRHLLSATDVLLVDQTSTTEVIITYTSGKKATITHTAVSAGYKMRDFIQDSVVTALSTGWTSPAFIANIPASIVTAAVPNVTVTITDIGIS